MSEHDGLPAGLLNVLGDRINPATEETLALILAALAATTVYMKRWDDAGSGVVYFGQALPGTATSSASWQIRKIDQSATPDFTVTFAGAGAFNQIWDDRAGLSYS